jgi:hypothetical protein
MAFVLPNNPVISQLCMISLIPGENKDEMLNVLWKDGVALPVSREPGKSKMEPVPFLGELPGIVNE